MAIRQEQLLKDVEFQIYEKNSGVAGTWYENKYRMTLWPCHFSPTQYRLLTMFASAGAACDVPAHNYTFSFAPKTDWTQ
jgi:cyclohexanone monooxygenase